MSLSRPLRRTSSAAIAILRRFCSTTSTTDITPHEFLPPTPHEFLPPNEYLNSWTTPKNPIEAKYKLGLLRRQYAKQVKQIRKTYIHEMEVKRLEKMQRDEAKKEAQRIATEARRVAKEAAKKLKAQERELLQQDFRETLIKERAEKLEYWRAREKFFEEKKKATRELIRRKSSMWIAEAEMEKKLLENVVETTSL